MSSDRRFPDLINAHIAALVAADAAAEDDAIRAGILALPRRHRPRVVLIRSMRTLVFSPWEPPEVRVGPWPGLRGFAARAWRLHRLHLLTPRRVR